MASLERVSSFDSRLQSLSSPQTLANEARDYAARVLQLWVLRRLKLSRVRTALVSRRAELLVVLRCLSDVPSQSFDATTASLTDPVFSEALSSVLTALPVDPVLRNRNSMARSARFIGSAVLVRWHASQMLTATQHDSLDTFVEDVSEEAKFCKNAASMVCSSMAALISSVLEERPLNHFRAKLVGFRFAVRYFVESMSAWRRLDSDRMAAALQATFVEVYGVLISLETSFRLGNIQEEEYRRNKVLAMEQFARIEYELKHLLGTRANGAMEELKAFCEAMLSQGDLTSETRVTLQREAGDQAVEQTLTSTPAWMVEVVGTAKRFSDFKFTDSESQLVSALTSVTDTPLDLIIYEVCVSDKFTFSNESPCPEFKPFEYADLEGVNRDAKQFLRSRFLQILGDRLISSLTPSIIEDIQQVFDHPLCSLVIMCALGNRWRCHHGECP